jgi:hypothetical protein
MGSLTYTFNQATRHISPYVWYGFAYTTGYMLGPALPVTGISYPPASPHRLTTTWRGPSRTPHASPEGSVAGDWVVSTTKVRHGRIFAGTGISTRCPSTTPFGLALGPDLPRAD